MIIRVDNRNNNLSGDGCIVWLSNQTTVWWSGRGIHTVCQMHKESNRCDCASRCLTITETYNIRGVPTFLGLTSANSVFLVANMY